MTSSKSLYRIIGKTGPKISSYNRDESLSGFKITVGSTCFF